VEARDRIVVFGAYGHTGRFVASELRARGATPLLAGRDERKLEGLRAAQPDAEVRLASVESPSSLDCALEGASAVINCAGPFADTSGPLLEAAVRARIPYLDITAEQRVVLAAFEGFDEAARRAGVVVLPAMAFYGGLADLLATKAMGDWTAADEVQVAVGLDGWRPTIGTRLTGKRNVGRRFVVSDGALGFLPDPPPLRTWPFPDPFGTQEVVGLGFSEIITISRHLRVPEVHAFMNLRPIQDVRDPDTPPPTAADDTGRSSQVFLMDVIVRKGDARRRVWARGRDIYAVTAPLVVEATERVLGGRVEGRGVLAPGQAFDAADFLGTLSPTLSIETSRLDV
jgi:short subunit dehydrogenase-like uncharacterized protein